MLATSVTPTRNHVRLQQNRDGRLLLRYQNLGLAAHTPLFYLTSQCLDLPDANITISPPVLQCALSWRIIVDRNHNAMSQIHRLSYIGNVDAPNRALTC